MTNEFQNLVVELTDELRQMGKNDRPDCSLVRVERPVPMLNLFSWLSQQIAPQRRAYWEDRDSDYKVASLGRSWSYRLTRKADVKQQFPKL